MTKHDYKQNAYYMLYLIRCVLHNKIPAKEKLDKMNLLQLYEVAQAHSLTAITAYALEYGGINDTKFKESKSKAIRKAIYFEIERSAITSKLEKAGIWYMPLKGIILKEYYPQTSMREMYDNDILFDNKYIAEVKQIMRSLGYHMSSEISGHDLNFLKEPVLNFEMHYTLFTEYENINLHRYYSEISERLMKSSKYERKMTNEDFYIYLTAHEYKHFVESGIGLKVLVDDFVFLDKFEHDLDWDYINTELDRLGLYEYEKERRNLSQKLFSGIKLNEKKKKMLDYYIFSSSYGTQTNRIVSDLRKEKGSKIKYIFHRTFVSLDVVRIKYPYFYKHKFLIPILPIYRAVISLKHNHKNIINEIETLIKL